MNVGICIRHTAQKLEDSFATASQNGFRHLQLVSWEPALWTEEEAKRVLSFCKTYGMQITAFWCGWEGPKVWDFIDGPETLGLVPVSYRAMRIKNLLDGAAFAKKLNVDDVITHMGFIPENCSDPNYQGVKAAIRHVAEEYKKNGQNLLFETGQETPVVLLRLFEDLGMDNLFINLDPANLILYGKGNPVDAMHVFGKYVRGVHAKDGLYPTNGRELGKETAVGKGMVDFKALIRALKDEGFDGSLTIEREISGEQQLIDIRIAKAYLSELIETV